MVSTRLAIEEILSADQGHTSHATRRDQYVGESLRAGVNGYVLKCSGGGPGARDTRSLSRVHIS